MRQIAEKKRHNEEIDPYIKFSSRIREMENVVTPCIDAEDRIMRLAILAPTTRHAASLHYKHQILYSFLTFRNNFYNQVSNRAQLQSLELHIRGL